MNRWRKNLACNKIQEKYLVHKIKKDSQGRVASGCVGIVPCVRQMLIIFKKSPNQL